MDKKDSSHPVIIKAKELADSIKQSDGFRKGDPNKLQALIIECNEIINEKTKINYGATCQPKKGCCG